MNEYFTMTIGEGYDFTPSLTFITFNDNNSYVSVLCLALLVSVYT